jgi:hypothetical protein
MIESVGCWLEPFAPQQQFGRYALALSGVSYAELTWR